MGLTTNGKPVAFNGEGGVAMTINGIAVKEVEQSPVLPLVAVNPMATVLLPAPVVPPLRFRMKGAASLDRRHRRRRRQQRRWRLVAGTPPNQLG
jgi:hypothetical protein